ncbi:unnamed protein product [Clonostachys byssicola]|uniref:Neutral protease 2 n=1 Tax=Clonostachys byssicola TaxID=160290 RepID=A0A9N9UI41_9HYPO|nr:unnamed protein product [Clonostachys byssicola]
MKLAGLFFCASIAAAFPLTLQNSLDVKLERQGNSQIKATVTNFAGSGLNILKHGSIFDNKPVEKARVYSTSKLSMVYPNLNNLNQDSFVAIGAGESIEEIFDVAEFHNLASGGSFTIWTDGVFQYAPEGTTNITGSIPFKSNSLKAEIDGAEASSIFKASVARRAKVASSCSSKTNLPSALSSCKSIAQKASTAAKSGGSKLTEYFKSDSSSVRSTVANVFDKVASECGSTTGGNIIVECNDVSNFCEGNIAYADTVISTVVFCPYWYTMATSGGCHVDTQAGIVIHEFTHIPSVKGTDDYGAYGYEAVRALTAAQNLNHADTYHMYSNAINVGC